MEKEKNTFAHHGEKGSLEWFLRRNFGLKGPYHSPEFEAVIARIEASDSEEERERISDEWFGKPDWEPCKNFSKEAWDAWERALEMVNDLEAMGILDEIPGEEIRSGFCDNA